MKSKPKSKTSNSKAVAVRGVGIGGCCRHKQEVKSPQSGSKGHPQPDSHHRCVVNGGRSRSSSEMSSDPDGDGDSDSISSSLDAKCNLSNTSSSSAWDAALSGIDFQKRSSCGAGEEICSFRDAEELLQNVRGKRDQLMERLQIYNNLLKFHKDIKEDVYLYRKLQDMDELYLRNTGAILRLGFCHCAVHQQTSPVGDKLMKIHKKLRVWDKKIEDFCDLVKTDSVTESSIGKTANSVLHLLNLCDGGKTCDAKANSNDIGLPEIVWDLHNPYIEELDVPKLTEEWRDVRAEVRNGLCKAELTFQEVCLEFGVTRGPEKIPSTGKRLFSYDFDYDESKHEKIQGEEDEEVKKENGCNNNGGETGDNANGCTKTPTSSFL